MGHSQRCCWVSCHHLHSTHNNGLPRAQQQWRQQVGLWQGVAAAGLAILQRQQQGRELHHDQQQRRQKHQQQEEGRDPPQVLCSQQQTATVWSQRLRSGCSGRDARQGITRMRAQLLLLLLLV